MFFLFLPSLIPFPISFLQQCVSEDSPHATFDQYASFTVLLFIGHSCIHLHFVELVRNVMAHAQKPDLVFQRNGRVQLNRRGCQFSRLLAVKECGSADSNCIDRAPSSSSRLLATHSICTFPLHFSSRASPCAIRFRTRYNTCAFLTRSVQLISNLLQQHISNVQFLCDLPPEMFSFNTTKSVP